jgi:hypothetical protein
VFSRIGLPVSAPLIGELHANRLLCRFAFGSQLRQCASRRGS